MSDDAPTDYDQCLLEEVEALKAIMFSELDVVYSPGGRPLELQTTLYPSTADDTNQQYVCLQLYMKFPPKYPDEKPLIELRNPRGLGEDFLANALKQCHEKCCCFSGSPVIYELIELLRECLTNSNLPTGNCTICLFDFHPDDVFTYTPCYHHFHSHCLSRFCENLKEQWREEEEQEASNAANWKERKTKQFTCPVCREVINVDFDALKQAPPPYEVERFSESFMTDDRYEAWRKEMEDEYCKQKAKGGIIDREAEDSRFLVVTEGSSSTETTPSPDEDPHQSPAVADVSTAQASSAVQPVAKPSSAQPGSIRSDAAKSSSGSLPPNRTNGMHRGRGGWIHRSDAKGHKERNSGVVGRPASNIPRRSKNESSHSRKELLGEPGCTVPPAPSRPPPGFEPR